MPKPTVDERPKLSLEDYVLFFATRRGHGLTIDHLNQIIFMHGFIKLHRHQKSVIVEALNSFDLMRPRRSTVGSTPNPSSSSSSSASAAALSVDEVKRDIDDLGWRECPVGSLLSISSSSSSSASSSAIAVSPLAAALPPAAACGVSPSTTLSASSMAEKRKGKREAKGGKRKKKKRVTALLTLPSSLDASAAVAMNGEEI